MVVKLNGKELTSQDKKSLTNFLGCMSLFGLIMTPEGRDLLTDIFVQTKMFMLDALIAVLKSMASFAELFS